MPTGVVHILELIQIDKQQRTRCLAARDPDQFFFQLLDKAPSVEQGQVARFGGDEFIVLASNTSK